MTKEIDCLFIGHNEMNFHDYEKMVRTMGINSGAYKDLNFSFISYKGKHYTAPETYNYFGAQDTTPESRMNPFNLSNTFSATIAYLGTYLHRRGLTFDYVNSFQEEKDVLVEKLLKNNIMTIAIPTTLYLTPFPIVEIINFVKKYNNTAKIIVGGPFISTQVRTQADSTLKYIFKTIGAEFYINSSQGEGSLVQIINAVKNNDSYDRINNIFYLKGDKYIPTLTCAEDNKLENNMVDWNLFKDRVGEHVMIRTSISCPFSCLFCAFPQHAGRYQTVSVDAVEQELNSLKNIEKVECVYVIDDTFNIPVDRFKEMLRMFIRNKYKFKWNGYFRCQFADSEMIELMKESGCEGVFLGVESGSQKILKNMNKAVEIDKYKFGLELLNKYGITTYASFIIGFPGETDETVQETIAFIEENKPTFYRAQLWYCDPYTPIWKEKEKYDIKGSQFEWSHATMDSKKASKLIDNLFVNVKNSIWVPQYTFEVYGIYNLLHRSMSLEQVKTFISAFNSGVKEKIINPSRKEVSSEVVERIKIACNISR